MHPSIAVTALVFTLSPASVLGTTVHKCQDAKGNITFTQLGCPPEHSLELREIQTSPPSEAAGTAETNKPAGKPRTPTSARAQENTKEFSAITGIGLRDDGCGNVLTSAARRKAMMDKEARAGMTQADVQSMLGKPDSISSQNGKVRFSYVDKHSGRKRSISFDTDGCVKP